MVGFSILDLHSRSGLSQAKLAHRIMRERSYLEYGIFSETLMNTDESILLALNGYAYDGTAMTDSSTGLETKFAFSGDPVTGTGWLDVRHDSRALQSIAPFDLAPSETKSMMVVVVAANGSDLEEGISKLFKTYDDVIRNRALWDN